jgi:hypothetical protein
VFVKIDVWVVKYDDRYRAEIEASGPTIQSMSENVNCQDDVVRTIAVAG